MSASSKKKLRNEAASAKLTERQAAEQSEAKKLKVYTVTFAVVLAALVVIAAWVGISRGVANSGIHEKNTIAATVGEHKISNAELSYYYIDAVNNFASNYGSYAALYGLDTTLPLNEQITNEETGATWADDFIESGIASARATYALADAANAAGFTISDEDLSQLDVISANLETYANLYGYSNGDAYLKAMYGNGASKAGYLDYVRTSTLASSYQQYYQDNLNFSDSDLRAADSADSKAYNGYSFNQYYLSVSRFLTGGSVADDGSTEYSDTEKAAAVAAAEEAAKQLTADSIVTADDLDEAIAALTVNEGTSAKSTAYSGTRYNAISSTIADWVSNSSRKSGDKTYIASTSTDADGNETVNGYYVVLFNEVSDNAFPLVNVRHILVTAEGGTTDANGNTTYTDEEMAAAKKKAEDLLAEWKSGEATEESFAAMASENTSDPGSISTGGLYEDVYPGQMVANFNDWCFDSSRKVGDTGVIETDYGYHVMFFVGNSDMTYRDSMIREELVDTAMESWYNGLVDACTVTNGDTQYMRKDLVLNNN